MYSRDGGELLGYYYEAIQVNVVETDCYTLMSNSSIDTFGYIYDKTFNPLDPSQNMLARNDDGLDNTQFQFSIYLRANTSYILIVTISSPNVTGDFSILIYGSNNVSLNHIGECS